MQRNGGFLFHTNNYLRHLVSWEMDHQCTDLVLTNVKTNPKLYLQLLIGLVYQSISK